MRGRAAAAALAALMAAGPAAAQEAAPAAMQAGTQAGPSWGAGGWRAEVTLYAWLPAMSTSLDTELGKLEGDVSGSDTLANLDFAFMGAVEARRGRWGFIGDLIYSDISADRPTEHGVLFRHGVVETRMTVLSGYAAYRLHETDRIAFDVAGGFRGFSTNLSFTLKGNLAETRRVSDDQDWVVPLVAARVVMPLTDRWSATLMTDLGGNGDERLTWQALALLRYAFNERWSVAAAYRYMDVEYEIGGRDAEIELYGPAVGVTFAF